MLTAYPLCRALTLTSVPHSRSLSCSDKGQKELALPLHPSTPCWNGSSAPPESSGAVDHLKQRRAPGPRPLSAGMHGHFPDVRAVSVASFSSPLPSPVPSSYRSQLAIDQQTGQQPPSSPASAVTQPASPRSHDLNSPAYGLEEGMWKRASLPQRPPPPWVKWAHAVREDGFAEDASAPECANLKHCEKKPSLPSSCSTSEPDTPGRISLRISESALQPSPPPRGDIDDEVFVKDLHPKVTSSPTFEALPPPPPPPSPPSQEPLANGADDFPPPPPQALCEVLLDGEASTEAGSG